MPSDPAVQLREALVRLKAEGGTVWLDVTADAVVGLGGGDAVDLLQIRLEDALAEDTDDRLGDEAGPETN